MDKFRDSKTSKLQNFEMVLQNCFQTETAGMDLEILKGGHKPKKWPRGQKFKKKKKKIITN